MMLARLKTLAAVLLTVGLITLGGGLLAQSLRQDALPAARDSAAGRQEEAGKGRATKGQKRILFEGHTGPVLAVAISPDGKLLASAGADGLRIWALEGGEPLTTPARGAGAVNGLAFSPDGKLLALADSKGVVKLWDAVTKQETGELKGHTGAVLAVAFSPDGRRLASGGADGALKLWTVNGAGDPIACKNPRWRSGPVRAVAFSPDGTLLAAAGGATKAYAGWLALWDARTGEVLSGSEGDTRGFAVAFSPDGNALASGGKAEAVPVWGTRTGSIVRQFDQGHGKGVYAVAFSRDGRRLITAGADGVLKIWDLQSDKQISTDRQRVTRRGHTGPVRCLAVSPDGTLLATGGDDHTVRVWTLPVGQ
jgi:WD40 repeat protein